jgi:hypothetical protein
MVARWKTMAIPLPHNVALDNITREWAIWMAGGGAIANYDLLVSVGNLKATAP